MHSSERFQARQGDVFIEAATSLPAGAREVPRDGRGRLILALGERTGHAHAITDRAATLYEVTGQPERWLAVRPSNPSLGTGGVVLGHEEHSRIVLQPGVYRVRQQREYSPSAIRAVVD
jgi:hypothetical protein